MKWDFKKKVMNPESCSLIVKLLTGSLKYSEMKSVISVGARVILLFLLLI